MSLATPLTAESQQAGRIRLPPLAAFAPADGDTVASRIPREATFDGRVTHVERIPGRPGRAVAWPDWIPAELQQGFARSGISAPWAHQAEAADHARVGRNVIISTPAASGKSLGYLMPALTGVLEGGTALYLTPTKALAADQLRAIRRCACTGCERRSCDGDTPAGGRTWARAHASYLVTTPDTLHLALLPGHARWSRFLSRLRYVMVDECHGYRGVFGSHVAQVLRRLRRIAAYYAEGRPSANAPAGAAGTAAGRRPGSSSPRPPPPSRPVRRAAHRARRRGGRRRRVTARASHLRAVGAAADRAARRIGRPAEAHGHRRGRGLLPIWCCENMTHGGLRPLPARRAEAVAMGARRALAEAEAADQAGRVAAYRSGYLPEDRRMLEEISLGPPGGRGGHDRARAWRQHHRPGRGPHRRLAGHPRLAVAAGRAGRAGRPGRPGRADRPGRPAGHLPGASPGGGVRPPGRGDRARPGQPVRARPAPVRGGRRAAADRRRFRPVRPAGRPDRRRAVRARDCCATAARAGTWPAAAAR